MPALNEYNTPLNLPGLETINQRMDLAEELEKWQGAWEVHTERLRVLWDRLDDMMNGKAVAPGELPWDGAVYRNWPVLAPKARTWIDSVCNPPTQAKPYFLGTLFGKDSTRASDIEQDFYMFMERARWTRTFRRVTKNAGIKGKGYWRCKITTDRQGDPNFEFKSIAPRRYFMYPNVDDIKDALMIGHEFEQSPEQIERMRASGEYYKDSTYHILEGSEERPSNPPGGVVNNRSSIAVESKHKPRRTFEAIVFRDFGEVEEADEADKGAKKKSKGEPVGPRFYRVRFTKEQVLLGVYKYPYSRPWYFDEWIWEDEDEPVPSTSKIGSLQDLQLNKNNIGNLVSWGMEFNALGGTTYTIGWGIDRKYARNKPGSVIPLHSGGQATNVQSQGNPGVGLQLLGLIDQEATEVVQIGQQQQGGTAQGSDHTALAAQIRQQGVNKAIDGDLENIDECMTEMAEFMQELFKFHYPEFLLAYGDNLATQPDPPDPEKPGQKAQTPKILSEKILWSLFGKTPDLTPQAQTQAVQGLVQTLTQLANPELIQALTGLDIDVKELAKAVVSHSTLVNKDQITLSDEKKAAMLAQQQQAAMAAQQQAAAQGGQPGQPPAGPGLAAPPPPGIPGAQPAPAQGGGPVIQ